MVEFLIGYFIGLATMGVLSILILRWCEKNKENKP